MSVGGRVVEVLRFNRRLWVNTMEPGTGDLCAIYTERFPGDEWLTPGDSLWWQGDNAFWTPQTKEVSDFPVPRVGFSGVRRPVAPHWDDA